MLAVTAAAQQKQPDQPPLNVSIDGGRVKVTNATPGGKVVFFGIARFFSQHRVTVRRFEKFVADDDRDGTVVLEIGEELPWKTVFAAIDFTSGRYGRTTTRDFPLLPMEFTKEIFASNNGQLERLVIEHRFVDMLHVRPGVGAWGQVVGDGNKFDDDARGNGKAVANVARGWAVGDEVPAPKKFDKGDILVLIDAQKMESFVTEVGSK